MKRLTQKGTTTVEFAIVASIVMLIIFGVLGIARAFYVYAMLDEVTRRATRLAAVCPINDPSIQSLALFNASGSTAESSLVRGLTPGNVVVDYLDENGAVVGAPTTPEGFIEIRYVRARIVGFSLQMFIPFLGPLSTVTMPQFESVLPRESLGIPREGAVTPC